MFGHGTFVYDPDYALERFGSASGVADEMLRMGMRHAWLRVHNKNGPWRLTSNRKIARELKSRGIQLGVWGWNDGNDISQDIHNAKKAIDDFEPAVYIADIEHGVQGADWNSHKAERFCKAVKRFLGEMPLVVSSFGYIPFHQPEMMSAIDDVVDYFAPQVYWFWFPKQYMLQADPALSALPKNNAAAYAKVCLHEWRKAVTKPIVLTGQAYWGEASGWAQKTAELKLDEFIADFDEFAGLAGLNWWNFAAPKAMSHQMRARITAADFPARLGSGAGVPTRPSPGPTPDPIEPSPPRPGQPTTILMIAAEGLNFRSEPVGGLDDNVIAALDYGAKAIVTGGETANGYLPCIVELDGVATPGYLHKAYLRALERPEIERAIAEAVGEWKRFRKGAGIEDKEPFSSYINEMWTSVGRPSLTGMDTDQPWSAAFISFILRNAGYERTKFDVRHSTYINEAIQNRIIGADRDFWGYRITEAKPQIGDLICQWRRFETTYDEAESTSRFPSHTDIVIAVRPRAAIAIGGNVVNVHSQGRGVTVETKTFSLDSNGFLPDRRRVFALMKNRFRPVGEQVLSV